LHEIEYLLIKGKSLKKNYKQVAFTNFNEMIEQNGLTSLGTTTTIGWTIDPRRFAFLFSRYKFVSKMFSGYKKVLEIGCADGFASVIVANEVSQMSCTDYDKLLVDEAKKRPEHKQLGTKFKVFDFVKKKYKTKQDGIYCLDVFEHIEQKNEDEFLKNIVKSLNKNGTLIVGIPSLESQKYASKPSKEGHVNCKSGEDFKDLMQKYFHNVFLFSMNDEVVHTGYYPMSHYLIAVCCNKKNISK